MTLRKAVVEVEVRLVAVKSGKVLWVETGIGMFTLEGKTAPLSGFEGFGARDLDFARADFLATPLGKAVDTAVDRVGTMVLDSRDDLGVKQFSITLSVSSVEGETAILNMGKGLGLKVGRRLPVRRTTGEVKDKKSGVVLKRDSRRVAVVEVVAFDDLTTATRIISGEPVKVGDEVKVVMKYPPVRLEKRRSFSRALFLWIGSLYSERASLQFGENGKASFGFAQDKQDLVLPAA